LDKLFQKPSQGSLNEKLGKMLLPLTQKSHGETSSQQWPVRGGEIHIPIHFTWAFLWNEMFTTTLARTQVLSLWPSKHCSR
jgi:hypothetical protein